MPFLDPALKGSTATIGQETEEELSLSMASSRTKKTKIEDTLALLAHQGNTMVKFMEAAQKERKEHMAYEQKMDKLKTRIEIAKALGDTTLLAKLMEEANNSE